jgi:hypothetical protein
MIRYGFARSSVVLLLLCSAVFVPSSLRAQLSTQFSTIFSEILETRLKRSVGTHGEHFIESASQANKKLTPALNGLIVNNVSSFPLTSSTIGVTFDLSTGVPLSSIENLGPIFSENASTLGKLKLNLSLNYSYLDLSRFRGSSTEEMRFSFTHQNADTSALLGDDETERDIVDIIMGMNVRAHIVALVGTIGITDELDVSIGIPIVSINLNGTAKAIINSYTFARNGVAIHNFGNDPSNPILETSVPYDRSATGLGDIAVRLKYALAKGANVDIAALADVRIPAGKEADFLGSGKANFRIAGVLSKRVGKFSPHVNLGYEHRSADFQSSRLDVRVGFDQMVLGGLSVAVDFLGFLDLNKDKAISLFPGTRTISYTDATNTVRYRQNVDLSNVPERDNDNRFDLSVGFRAAPSEKVIVLANVIVPMNDGGLRASVVPTLGLMVNF